MNLYNLFEAPKNMPQADIMPNNDQSSSSPIGSGTSRWEQKKKPVTMMGVGNKGVVAEARDVQLDEISNRILGDYKKAAAADATAADKAGDIERGNKRFKGIVKATIKQGDNDAKRHKEQGVAEGKVKLYTDPSYFGAEVDDTGFDSLPVVNIPTNRLVGFEPDSKMQQPKAMANVKNILAGLEQGDNIPPILVRKYKNGYQVLDGHHRFWAYKVAKKDTIPARVVDPKDIEEVGKQGVAEGIDTEEFANKVYAEFERIYPNLARRADERTVHAAIMDVLNYGGDSDPSALAQDVARAVNQEMQQGMAEGKKPDNYHIVNKDGKPATLASYADRASAENERDAKHPGAEVRQLGPRGKVKGVSESLGRATPKMPKARDPGHAVLAAKRSSGAAGRHTNKKRQEILQPKHKQPLTKDMDLDEGWKSKLGGAALAGAMALGGASAQAADYQPNMVAHIVYSVNGKNVAKDINLGSQYSSAREASDAVSKLLQSKGIKYFTLDIERVGDDQVQKDYMDSGPATDQGRHSGVDARPYRATATASQDDYMVKEELDESIERRLMQMRRAGYDIN